MKILITGKNGQVGWELNRYLHNLAEVYAFDKLGLDLSQPDQILKIIREVKPDIIINAAAYTAVDLAESDQENAELINANAPGILAEEAKRLGSVLIHYSTDAVFDGEKRAPYLESDLTNPINVYGFTKLAGEKAIEQVGVPHMIFRTSWIFANRGNNFMRTILKLASQQNNISVVNDQIGAPTSAEMVAKATTMILKNSFLNAVNKSKLDFDAGIYNMTSHGQTSWYEFAVAIIDLAKKIGIQKGNDINSSYPNILPISSSEYPLVAKRGMYSVLDNQKLNNSFSISLLDWRIQLELCLNSGLFIPKFQL
ncbi:MAG: dTDP-4-dehydrorhamnose reductase [Methylovulum sp.]|nr:dTDP-4-dehydrorhamnose reductase [Methylovulum sp.]